MKNVLTYCCCLILLISCGPSRFVEPLQHKQVSIGGHFGGPVIDFGAPIPIPITSVEAGYGIDTNITAFAALHTTAIFFGDLQMDIGTTFKLMNQNKYKPNLSLSPGFNFIYSPSAGAVKFWPTIDINTYWNYGNRSNYFYVGLNNYFELSSTMANNQPQETHWLYNPQIGHVIKGKNKKGQLTTEVKWLGPNFQNDYAFIPYYTPQGSQGALGIYIGYKWILNSK